LSLGTPGTHRVLGISGDRRLSGGAGVVVALSSQRAQKCVQLVA
jgi:hypothetical protein